MQRLQQSLIKAELHLSSYHQRNLRELVKYLPKFLSKLHLEYIEKFHASSEDNLYSKLLKRLKALPNLRISMFRPTTKNFQKTIENLKHSPSTSSISLQFLKDSSLNDIRDISEYLKSTKNITSLNLDFSQSKISLQSFIDSLAISLKSLHSLKFFTINLGEHSKVTRQRLALLHKSLHRNPSLKKFHLQISRCQMVIDLSFLKSTKSSKFKGPISSLEYDFHDTYVDFDAISNLVTYIKSFETLKTLKLTINACFCINKKCFDFIAEELRSLQSIQNLSLDFSKNYGLEAQDLVVLSCSLPYLACLTSLSLSLRDWKMSKDQINALCCGIRELKGLKRLGLDFSNTKIHLESFNEICESMRQAGGLEEVFIGLEGVEIDTRKVILSVTERLGYLKFLRNLEVRFNQSDGLWRAVLEIFNKKFENIRAVII